MLTLRRCWQHVMIDTLPSVIDPLPVKQGAWDRPLVDKNKKSILASTQSALEFCPIHCPNGRLGQDLGFGGFAFALKFPELLNRNFAAVRAKILQTSCFPNGDQFWCPIGQ